ncbi:uncharacterized protein BO87DRAFT_387936 [Aspergillus neoniger CBS 115656]|uniref:Uncharacterized protein n=1 Tax=Aspergillus neoniger (strain CBS 115656) TaxID=1448310 RepID=A0A318Z7E1_ASPNB|nr:hypothetical protein BO87DRAFT_387936 [Aspergillus neoniger CBS 115656]PYH32732.1 hypothetical protein BO87DRAFT_387936 [Aspergillus neoniger CBS 115656]
MEWEGESIKSVGSNKIVERRKKERKGKEKEEEEKKKKKKGRKKREGKGQVTWMGQPRNGENKKKREGAVHFALTCYFGMCLYRYAWDALDQGRTLKEYSTARVDYDGD